ncbi:hypothetical protein ACIBO9_43530 [Streptomyces prunicolor]|uniref:hypothetical protein n=1 Tax=Streptomyces prunicolor TaxID=67348 RepID=UPI0037CD6E64
MRNRSWIAAAVATAGVVLGAALYAHELETGHADVDVAAPKVSQVPKVSKAPKASAPERCVGTRPVGSLPTHDDNSPMYRLAGHIDALAVGAYAAVYTGLSVDDRTQTLDVWRIPSARFDTAVCGAALKGVTVRLHDSDVSRKSLDKLSDRIGDDMKRWDGTFRMREVGVNERGFVRVGVDDPDKAEPIIKKAYGAKNARYIKVEYVGQASALSALVAPVG